MKRAVLLFILVIILISCDKFHDPTFTNIESYSFYFSTINGMKLEEGQLVDSQVVFWAHDNLNYQNPSKIKVKFEVIEGSGSVTIDSSYTNNNEPAYTKWKLGTGSCRQTLRARSYDENNKLLTSTDLIEYGFRKNTWDEYTGYPEGNMTCLVTDTASHLTYMISSSGLYKQDSRYYIWESVTNPLGETPSSVLIDRKGTLYISTYSGKLIKSEDHGNNWKYCTDPFAGNINSFVPQILNDNSLWAYSNYVNTARLSKDGGNTWINVGSDIPHGYVDVFHLKDGSYILHGNDVSYLYRSFDDCRTWTKTEVSGLPMRIFVDDNDNLFLLSQESGITIKMSTDYGNTFKDIYSVYPAWKTTALYNIFMKSGNLYYIFIPGFGILTASDITNGNSYREFYVNNSLGNMFICQDGTLIGMANGSGTIYYYHFSE